MLLGSARRSGSPESLAAATGEAVERLEQEIGNLRALITDLRPAALDEFGAKGALETLALRVERNGIEVALSVELAERHTPELEAAIYRIVQEALTNTVKHGGVTKARVEVSEDGATVHVVVRDDGAGFDPGAATAGFGLLGMRERVELLGGTLDIESTPGTGTTVRVSLPAQGRAAPDDTDERELRAIEGY